MYYFSLVNLFDNLSYNLLSLFALTLLLLSTTFLYKWLLIPSKSHVSINMPPSPPKLPIIGHLHLLGKLPHRSLRLLSQKYGDLMLLYFGNRPVLVVSSAKAAEEILKTHDLIFANRPKLRYFHRIFYEGNDMVFDSYGAKWRRQKSICVLQLLSNKRVNSFRSIREEEISQVIQEIKRYKSGSVINLSEIFMTLISGLTCRTALGKKFVGNDKSGSDLRDLFKELVQVLMEVSFGDYIPSLGWVDKLKGTEGRAESVRKRFDEFVEDVIQDHEARFDVNQVKDDDDDGNKVKDFVDVLLEIQSENQEKLSREHIKGLILDIFAAGTETSSTTLEWAMTEILRQPKILKKLQEEVRYAAKYKTSVTEDDLENMKYLKAVVKETLRLHPPLPILLFHESSQKVKINNYDINARTQVIVNAWAIQRDPEAWQDPEDFDPNHFLDDSSFVDYRGQHFQFIPFGAGRRGCPGITYGIGTVEIVLARFLYEFEWTLPNLRKRETLDTEERAGMAVGRQNPLMVIATPTLLSL